MSESELTVSSTTDELQTVQSVAEGNEEGGRATVEESSLKDFRQSESEDGTVSSVSFEHPQSERQTLIERLEADAAELVELTAEPEAESGPEAGNVDLSEVRRVATADAVAEGRRRAQQQSVLSPEQAAAAYAQVTGPYAQALTAKIQEVGRQNPERWEKASRNLQAAMAAGIDISADAMDAILTRQAVDAWYRIAENPAELRSLAALPPAAQAVRIWELQSQADQQRARRTRSNAPAPINPLRGSSTKSSVDLSDTDYQTYKRVREAEIRARRGR